MAQSARAYLIDRFRGDAEALRARCDVLQRGTRVPGPDLATSRQMATACDRVTALLEGTAPQADARAELQALLALIPTLEREAATHAASPPVRAVFAGAATRIREVDAAEQRAASASAEPAPIDDDADDDRVEWDDEDDAT